MIVDTLQSAFQDDLLFKYIMSDSLCGIDALRWYFTEAITHPHSEVVQSQDAEAVLVWISGEVFPPKFTQDPPKQFVEVFSRMELHEASPEGYIAQNGVR